MAITPVEIRSVDLQHAWLRGYRRSNVEELLEEIADAFQGTMRERDELSARLKELETDASAHRELETLLRSMLASAESAAQEMKEQARRESDLIVLEAHAESRRISRECAAEKRRLEEDVSKIRAQLIGAFEMLGEWPPRESTEIEEAASDIRPAELGEALGSGLRNVTGHGASSEAGS